MELLKYFSSVDNFGNGRTIRNLFEKIINCQATRLADAKSEGLTDEELVERDKLRRIYIDSVKASLVGQLENTYIVDPDGTKHKLKHK